MSVRIISEITEEKMELSIVFGESASSPNTEIILPTL
jgi:hypothetical protein